MRSKQFVWVFLAYALAFGSLAVAQQSAEQLLQSGLYAEDVEGDLQKAIKIFRQVIQKYPEKSEIAADAQLHIGFCYEKLGNAEAVKAYELVLKNYSGQAKQVAEAQSRLATLRKEEPASLTLTRLLTPGVYLEFKTLSPDGTKMVGIGFNKGQNVAFYDFATEKSEFITSYDWGEKACSTNTPIWSPDSKEVAYLAWCGEDPETPELRIANLDGKSRTLFRNTDGGGLAPCDWLPGNGGVLALKGRERVSYSLVLISTKDGSCRELSPLQRTYSTRDPAMAQASRSADASPDARFIAFADGPPEGTRDIHIISVDGSSKVPLTDHPADDMEPRWSPDGRHIVFLSLRHGSWALWAMEVKEGKPEGAPFMLLEGMQNTELASWTKRGLVTTTFSVIQDLYICEINPQSHELKGKPQVIGYSPSGTNISPAWSPDGKHLAFVSTSVNDPAEGYVVVMPAEGGTAQKFRIPTRNFWKMAFRDLRWRPDSAGLGFSHWDNENRYSFFQLDLGTEEWKTRPLNVRNYSSSEWRGDGRGFFYSRWGKDVAPGLIEHDLESGQEQYLLRAEKDRGFPWFMKASRDYKQLATFSMGAVEIIDTGTKEKTKSIKWEKARLILPAWSPDGNHLVAAGVVIKDKETERDYYIISLKDGQVKPLGVKSFMKPGEQLVGPPDWSLDGRKIAFSTRLWEYETNLIQNVLEKK